MTTPRIYLSPELYDFALTAPSEIVLKQEISHHLLNVLRLQCGEELRVFNGQGRGGEFVARLIAIAKDKKLARIELMSWCEGIVESPLTIHLGQGIARGEKMDFILQKAVELGVNCIAPLFTEFSNVKLDKEHKERFAKRREHWQKIAIHASEQCGRCYVPSILVPQSLADWIAMLGKQNEVRVTLSPHADIKFANLPKANNMVLLVGPEGGLSEKETEIADKFGFVGARLGPRVLRTETAALVALSVLQATQGDL